MRTVWVGKRQASRSACLIKAEIRTGDDKFIAPCSVVDMSKSGARAKVEPGIEIPAMFALFLPARKETRVCKLRWHRETEIGIEFIGAEQITTFEAVITLELRVAALEAAAKSSSDDKPAALPSSTPAASVSALEPLARRISGLEAELAALSQAGFAAPAIEAAPDKTEMSNSDRLGELECQISGAVELVQAQIAETLKQNLPPRIEKLERQSEEILNTLRSLMPMLMNRAS